MTDKQTTKRIVRAVIEAKGGDARPFIAIAQRESAFNPLVKHELPGDVRGSISAWNRNKDGLFRNNPHIDNLALWNHGKGLFSFMPAYHLQRWDRNVNPEVLHNPYVASVTASRLARRHMQLGAKTWADVNQGWATGSPKRSSSWAKRRERFQRNLEAAGFSRSLADAPPNPGNWGLGPQDDQVEEIEAIRQQVEANENVGPAWFPESEDDANIVIEDIESEEEDADEAESGNSTGWIVGLGVGLAVGISYLSTRGNQKSSQKSSR